MFSPRFDSNLKGQNGYTSCMSDIFHDRDNFLMITRSKSNNLFVS